MSTEPSAEVGRTPRYRAFISYSSADRTAGEAFHAALERFRVPRPLRGRQTPFGPCPKSLAPVFRDRSDADASQNLSRVLLDALAASEALIVLCSPKSAQSKWVNREIREFKRLRPGAPVLPVIVDGRSGRHDPALRPEGAFPPALYDRVGPDGQVLVGAEPEPLAPDWRMAGDGPRFTVLKVAAALTGIRLTELTQRQAEAERRERDIARAVAAGMAGLALIAVAGGVLAWVNMVKARERLHDVIEIAASQTQEAADFRDQFGVPGPVIRGLLDRTRQRLDDVVADAADTPSMRLERARLAAEFADYAAMFDDAGLQELQARAALAALDRLERPSLGDRLVHVLDPPAAAEERGAVRQQAMRALARSLAGQDGKLAQAEATLRQARDAAVRDPGADHDLQVAENDSVLADLRYFGAGDAAGALVAYDGALAAVAGRRQGQDVEVDYQVASLRGNRAQMLLELQRVPDALAAQERAVADFRRLAAGQADNARFADALAAELGRLGDTRLSATNDPAQGLPAYQEALAIQERLHTADPARADYIRQLTATLERIVDARLMAPAPDLGAIAALQDRVVDLRRTLVARDAGNPEFNRDLAVALERAGDVALERRALGAARAAYGEALGLREVLLAQRLGDEPRRVAVRDYALALVRQAVLARAAGGTLAEIAAPYREAIARLTPFLADSETPAQWRFDVASWEAGLGEVLAQHGRGDAARAAWRRAAERLDALAAAYPDQPMYREWRTGVRKRLGA